MDEEDRLVSEGVRDEKNQKKTYFFTILHQLCMVNSKNTKFDKIKFYSVETSEMHTRNDFMGCKNREKTKFSCFFQSSTGRH